MSKIYVDEILPKDNSTVDGSKLSALPTSGMPTGSVLQVVQGNTDTITGTTSSTFVATTLAASITPSSTSSKILITYSGTMYHYSDAQGCSDIFRDGTSVTGETNGVYRSWLDTQRGLFLHAGEYLDSPNTTSSVEYKIYIRKRTGSYEIYFPDGGDENYPTITLMEIAG